MIDRRKVLAAAVALATAAPGPGFAQVVRVTVPVRTASPAPALNVLPAPSVSILQPSPSAPALTPSLLAAPSVVKPELVAAAKPSLSLVAENAAAALKPNVGSAAAKDAAGRSFDASGKKKKGEDKGEVAGAESSVPQALSPATPSSPKLKELPSIPVPARTFAARAKSWWPRALAVALASAASFLIWKFGGAGPGLMPLLGLAGTLAWGPTPGIKAAFLAAVRNGSKPGSVVPYAKIGQIGARLGLDADKAGEVFAELVQDGHFAIRQNRDAVFHSFKARLEGPHAPADEAALRAVEFMNSGASVDHARAVFWAEKAVLMHETSGDADGLAEAKALRGNAALELAGSMVAAHVADLESRKNLSPSLQQRLYDARAVDAWLRSATYQSGYVPPMPESVHKKLVGVLGTLNPAPEPGKVMDEEVADGYIAALDLLEKFSSGDYLFEGAAKPSAADSSWTPEPKLVEKFLSELRARTASGETATIETFMRAGKKFDLTPLKINAIVAVLAARGDLLVMTNGAVVFVDFRDQAADDRDGVWDIHNDALDAVRLVNSRDVRDHLKAVAALEAVRVRYFDVRKRLSAEAAAYQQTVIALANAKLEAASGIARAHEKALEASLAGARPAFDGLTREALEAKLAQVKLARAWLDKAYYSAERRQRIDAASLAALSAAVSLSAVREALGGKTEPGVTQGVMQLRQFVNGLRADAQGAEDDGPAPHPSGWRPLPVRDYPALTKFGSDVTRLAVEGKLPPMIGRKAEMRQIVKTLLRVEKNNPLIIGEKGVGKTAVANGLAQLIIAGEIPELAGKSVIKLDITKIVAGTSSRGEFEERMVAIIDEARKSEGRVLLFIDEIHMLVGAGTAEGSQDAANILKEALADGSLSVIGATTLEEYRKIEKDGALARRFNPVKLLAPTKDEAELIVEGVKHRYEEKHKVSIGAATVQASVALASRYITDRNLPDSALDLLDDASAEVELKASEAAKSGAELSREVTPEDVAAEIALRTGIPAGKVGRDEREKLKELPKELGAKVIGQDEAVTKVSKGVQRGRMGLRNPKQPIGAFIFLGPTGVGKTEIAKQTAKTVFGSEKNMVRLDMSEYMEKHSVSRMIGAPPGYAGFDQAGQLTEAVRRNPFTVILLDEIEKAHPDVLDVLLQVVEDGRLTDGMGRTVDFSNTIIMMTSNIGGSVAGEAEDKPRRRIGFSLPGQDEEAPAQNLEARRAKYLAALKAKLRPEFVNRVGEDGIVVFNELGKPEMEGILELRIKDLEEQLKDRGVTVELTAAARAEILKRAEAQKAYGARPLKQVVERQVSDAIVEAELEGRVGEGDRVSVDWVAAKGAFTAAKAP